MINITYNGSYPNLCRGDLIVTIGDKVYDFSYGLVSGGAVRFTPEWEEIVTTGPWELDIWPEDFPEDLKEDVLSEINSQIPWGCCGGCV